ncbi:SGNH/GDSL hydrolase family protein [Candidatus Pelagibacter sp.]|nr:SGNH/GDSL hydrolase family protein [Candidatus Pelagibacter sp.]
MNFLIKKFPLMILISSLLLLIYTFYKSEIFWDGNKIDYYKTYYLISSILIFFSIIAIFLNEKIKQYLIISGVSLIMSLYLFEGYLILNSGIKLPKKQILKEQIYEKETGKKWDKRSKIEIYEDLKKINDQIVMMVNPHEFLKKDYNIFPLSGISNSKTIMCNENGYYATYHSDRYGFNNPDNEWDKKEIEYLLIGDSFTQGFCVNKPNDIGSVLRDLSNKSILNLGMGGSGPLIEHAILREYINTNIKKVLWIYYEGNDLRDLKNEKINKNLVRYLEDENAKQNTILKQNQINNLLIEFINDELKIYKDLIKKKLVIEKAKTIVLFLKLNQTRILLNTYLPKDQQPNFVREKSIKDDFIKILKMTKNLTMKNNSKLYFVYLPEFQRYKVKYDNEDYNFVKDIVTQLKIPFIDIHKEVFEKDQNPHQFIPFEDHGHYNVEGYRKVAETIYKFTKN